MNTPIHVRFPFSFVCFSAHSVLTSTYCFEVLPFLLCKINVGNFTPFSPALPKQLTELTQPRPGGFSVAFLFVVIACIIDITLITGYPKCLPNLINTRWLWRNLLWEYKHVLHLWRRWVRAWWLSVLMWNVGIWGSGYYPNCYLEVANKFYYFLYHEVDVLGPILERDSCCLILVSNHLPKLTTKLNHLTWVADYRRFNCYLKKY